MADQPDYKHITVNPAEDDDIVIHAGAIGAASEDAVGEASVNEGIDGGGAVNEGIESSEAADDASVIADETDAAADSQEAVRTKEESATGMAANAVSATASRDAYQRTTLDDIQSSKMPRTQVAVIVVAVVAIIAFAVRYVFFS